MTLGEPFALDNTTAADILFDTQVQWKYHSAFFTDWFADLNYGPADQCASSPAYQAIASAARGWVERGVDGFRLDAVKHIYHNATSDENPRFLATFYDDMNTAYHAQGHADDIYMVGEVLSEHNEVAPYYAGLPALFEFSFWYRLEWAINNGTGRYLANDLLGYRQEYAAVRPDYIAATKLTNHDEDRAASLLGRNADKCRRAAHRARHTLYILWRRAGPARHEGQRRRIRARPDAVGRQLYDILHGQDRSSGGSRGALRQRAAKRQCLPAGHLS